LSAAQWHGKSPICQGLEGGDFLPRVSAKNTTRPLTDRTGGVYGKALKFKHISFPYKILYDDNGTAEIPQATLL